MTTPLPQPRIEPMIAASASSLSRAWKRSLKCISVIWSQCSALALRPSSSWIWIDIAGTRSTWLTAASSCFWVKLTFALNGRPPTSRVVFFARELRLFGRCFFIFASFMPLMVGAARR